jgi:hypothetical protein
MLCFISDTHGWFRKSNAYMQQILMKSRLKYPLQARAGALLTFSRYNQ